MNKILVVDDNYTNLKILKLILSKEHYEVIMTDRATEVEQMASTNHPDIILLDINMPDIDGIEICKRLKSNSQLKNIPVIFISALTEKDIVIDAFSVGAVDYITKPFNAKEVLARIATHIKLRTLQQELEHTNKFLQQTIDEQVAQISEMQMATIFSLAQLAQSRDDDTGKHLERVRAYCSVMAKALRDNSEYSYLIDDEFIENLSNASALHDIGKVGISDLILLKPEKLTDEEYAIMKTHTIIGFDTLSKVDIKFGNNEFIAMGKVVARSHHERWDGKGYPDKLKGEDIPLAARIMAIADVYDALRTKRVYKEVFSQEKCIEIIVENKGKQFDPVIVDKFIEIADEFLKISEQYSD